MLAGARQSTHSVTELDYIDLQLLKLLKLNARMSYARLAEELGISESAVRKRLRKLMKQGIIKRYTIEYDLGGGVEALVLIRVEPPRSASDISREVFLIEGVELVFEVAGDNDVIAYVRVPNIDMVYSCVNKIRSVGGVASTNTLIVLKVMR